MWELDCEESWAPKNWCFWTVVLEKTLESPLDCKEIQPVHSEGYQPWDFFGRNDAKAETPVLWPPHAKSWKEPLEEEMAPHSSILAWRIPGTGEPGRRPPMGSHRVGHDWSDLAAAAAAAAAAVWGVQGTLKSLLQHHSSKASMLQHSAFFIERASKREDVARVKEEGQRGVLKVKNRAF